MTPSTPNPDAAAIDATEVIAALDRVLGSSQFSRSTRSRGFLVYVVTQTLAGRGDRLHERTVARGALGRGADFDGRNDASVRVRSGLEEYYATDGADDPVRLILPRGSYVPVFERHVAPLPAVMTVPGVAVATLAWSGDDPAPLVARSLTDTLVQYLARYPDIRVVGPVSAATDRPVGPVAGDVSTVLVGHVSLRESTARLTARLLDAESGAVLWTADDVVTRADLARFDAEERWSRQIASALGDATGVVVRREMRRDRPAGTAPELAARLAFYSYVDRGTQSSIEQAIPLVDAALESGARTPQLLSMRAALANACAAYGTGDKGEELDRATRLAREALTLDGTCTHAHLVLGSAARDRQQWSVAIEHAETAVSLSPFHPSYLVGAGITLCGSGEWQRGSALIREAHGLHPGLSGHTHAWLAMTHLVEADYPRALAEASLLPSEDGYVWGPLYRAMALAALGYEDQSREEAARVAAMRPDVAVDLRGYLVSRMLLTDDQLTRLVALFPREARPGSSPGPCDQVRVRRWAKGR
jgi:adenylate cyclase